MEMLPIPSIAAINVPEPPNQDLGGTGEETDRCNVGAAPPDEFILNLL